MSATLLKATGMRKEFGGLRAIHDVSFEINEGEILSLIGPNGSGKTTLFNLITGFIPPSAGEILFRGSKITGLYPFEICRRGIARTFQHTLLFDKNTVLENLIIGQQATRNARMLACMFGLPSAGRKFREAQQRAVEIAALIGLERSLPLPAGLLPQVAQKQLSIGLALASGPHLLLLDEPMGGLTLEETDLMIALIEKIQASGVTICLIEHKMSVVMNISDRIMVLSSGEKIAEGRPAEISRDEKVIQSYLGEDYAAAG